MGSAGVHGAIVIIVSRLLVITFLKPAKRDARGIPLRYKADILLHIREISSRVAVLLHSGRKISSHHRERQSRIGEIFFRRTLRSWLIWLFLACGRYILRRAPKRFCIIENRDSRLGGSIVFISLFGMKHPLRHASLRANNREVAWRRWSGHQLENVVKQHELV